MNLDQAYKILNYRAVPEKREDHIKLIQIMGYRRLRGGDLLPDCYDRQLLRVAERLFRKAEQKAHDELNTELRKIDDEEDQTQYHTFLCDRFNIPEPERENYTINELEEQLMQ